MRLTTEEVEADISLPNWMNDRRYPDWLRDDRYRDISELEHYGLLVAARCGNTQGWFNHKVAQQRWRENRAAKRKAEEAALTDEERAANALRKGQKQRFAKLKARVTMYRNLIAKAEKNGDTLAALSLPGYRLHLQQAQQLLAAHVEQALRSEFDLLNQQ